LAAGIGYSCNSGKTEKKMKKIIYIPGFGWHKFDYLLIKLFLHNFKVCFFSYKRKLGQEKIENLAKQLNNFIKSLKLKKSEKVSIIAHSMGGLIAEYYLKFIDNKKVDKLITLCSPFKGTPWAFLLDKKGIKEMKPNSCFLKKLNNKKLKNVKEESIYSEEDFIVPHKSGRHLKSKLTLFFIHPLITFWPPVILEARRFLGK
jgi:hypothetical protein